MFIEDIKIIPNLAKKTNFSIFAFDSKELKKLFEKTFKENVTFLEPDEKNGKISVEDIRNFISTANSQEKKDRFFVVLNSEALNPAAANAFLKNLEEPKELHHFVLVTKEPSALLPTILSRAQIFYQKNQNSLEKPLEANEKIKTYAKTLVVADSKKLIELANDISKKKDNPRGYALEIVGTAIELLYKAYFSTNQEKFLKKLPKLLTLYDNLSKNGHIKLHFVADML
ncbi:hypothetical protein IKF63_02665 [Candidatus Saccharibacteria bacterium]|nr:hypothetical protein [Candidatus Saccharibacteria bacterium]